MTILPFRALLPNLSRIADQHHFFESVKEDFLDFTAREYFLAPEEPALYILRMQRAAQQATGLVCGTHIEDFLQGHILEHEKTIRSKEDLQIRLLLKRRAAVKPALLVHDHIEALRRCLDAHTQAPPLLELRFNAEEKHSLWKISRPEVIREIQHLYQSRLPRAAIADGHHRFAAFARLYNGPEEPKRYGALLTAYFPADELEIGAFHRLIELSRDEQQNVLDAIGNLGTLHPLSKPALPAQKHHMSIVTSLGWHHFAWQPALQWRAADTGPVLDVDLLHRHILKPLLGVKNIRTNTRIHYLEDIQNPEQLLRSMQNYPPGICFALYPIRPDDFLQVADLQLTLVPKATFFLPRLKNGLIVQTLD